MAGHLAAAGKLVHEFRFLVAAKKKVGFVIRNVDYTLYCFYLNCRKKEMFCSYRSIQYNLVCMKERYNFKNAVGMKFK